VLSHAPACTHARAHAHARTHTHTHKHTRPHAGIDMIPEQLAVANKHIDSYTKDVLKYSRPNMKFVKVRES